MLLPAHVRRNGAVQFYAKDLTREELAEASAYMTWLDSADGSGGSGGLSAGAIAGIAVGSAVAVAAAAAAAVFMVQRRRRPPVTDTEAAIRVLKVKQRLQAGVQRATGRGLHLAGRGTGLIGGIAAGIAGGFLWDGHGSLCMLLEGVGDRLQRWHGGDVGAHARLQAPTSRHSMPTAESSCRLWQAACRP